jgi:phosphoserine phosphatase RsbU/P
MSENDLKLKVSQLEQELRTKEAELARYKSELSRTNAELEKVIVDLGQELKMAGQIQKLLSPTEIPSIPGFEFSSKFLAGSEKGGDYFDIFEHDDKMKFGIVLACSSGYSMSALFLGVLIKLSSQIEAKKGLTPDQVLARMAQELVPQIENQDTASIFYGVFDRRSYELKYCSVGSMTCFILPHGQETLTRLEPSTAAFAKNYGEKPLAQTLQLNARDRLVLCTEGLLLAKNSKGESFGIERTAKAVLRAPRSGVHDVRNEVLFQVQQHTGLSEPLRDQTVIVVEVKDKVIKLAKQTSS